MKRERKRKGKGKRRGRERGIGRGKMRNEEVIFTLILIFLMQIINYLLYDL